VERLFPIEHANPGEVPKRWRLRGATPGAMASVTAAELADMATAASVLRRENMLAQARSVEKVAAKLRAHLKGPMVSRIEPDLEALTEAEGLAMRPGPRPKLDFKIISTLRHAILSAGKVRIHYRYRGSGKRGFDIVHPYGFLYGSRHYLVAWSENPQAQDFRNLALANIERVELLDQPFSRNNQFSLAAYAARSFGVFQEEPYRVVWKFDKEAAEQAKEFLFHPTQELQPQPDGSLVVRFTAGGALEMAWHLYIWGNHVKVIEPKNYWSHVRKTLEVSLP
jgi:predicted DNA-binding transcriptional regulator YafY